MKLEIQVLHYLNWDPDKCDKIGVWGPMTFRIYRGLVQRQTCFGKYHRYTYLRCSLSKYDAEGLALRFEGIILMIEMY